MKPLRYSTGIMTAIKETKTISIWPTALSIVQYSTFLLLTTEHNYDRDNHSALPPHTAGEGPGPAALAGAHHGAGVVDDEVSRPADHGYLVSGAITENIYHQLCPQCVELCYTREDYGQLVVNFLNFIGVMSAFS